MSFNHPLKRGLDERTVELVNPKSSSIINYSHDTIPIDNVLKNKLADIKRSYEKKGPAKKSKINNARVIYINNTKKNKLKYKYIDNFVTTSKYNLFNFFPKSLLFQFKRYANIYFLIITILQGIKVISPLNPITAIGPLVFVLMISIIREGMEDLARHKQDKEENTGKVLRYNILNGNYEENEACNLEVGDIIKINEYHIVPADCLLLSSSNSNKIAYLETANLDGEKDLKPKSCVPQIYKFYKDADEILRTRGKITINQPDPDLQKFNGKIELNNQHSYTVNIKQFLYKGTIIKNTKWALGVVLYTGKETKIILNSQKGASKESHLEALVNKLIGIIFLFQISLCMILALLNSLKFQEILDNHVYLMLSLDMNITNYTISGLVSFFSYLLLLNTMIPISLIVTIEVVKYSQAYFMNVDTEMYSFVKQKFVKCNTCSLNEELGQIKYIFSDKTGTLTANKLEFKVTAIAEEVFGMQDNDFLQQLQPDNVSKSYQLNKFKRRVTHQIGGLGMKLDFSFPSNDIKEYTVKGRQGKIYEDLILHSKNGKTSLKLGCTRDIINHYLYCLSLNQTIMVEKTLKAGKQEKRSILQRPRQSRMNLDGQKRSVQSPPSHSQDVQRVESLESLKLQENFNDYTLSYKGSNPDEIIFVDFARHMGFIYVGGDEIESNLKILRDFNGFNNNYEDQKFEILKIMEFSSTRGMMSVAVRMVTPAQDNKIILYSKGGDKKINALLTNDQPFLDSVKEKATKLSEIGLRVLWIAMKVIDPIEFEEWNKDYEDGVKQLVDEEAISAYRVEKYKKLEEGLTLIGCTAVEDKLQDKVPETIMELQTAGINVWVLTGDNLPTAKNIGLMCNLLPKNMDVYEINDDLDRFKNRVASVMGTPDEIEAIFNKGDLEDARKLIVKYEEALGVYQPENLSLKKDNIISQYLSEDDKKAILYVGLFGMLEKYKASEVANKAVLRGILVESEMLRIVLPADIHTDMKYYGHPLTKLFLELTLNSQAVICCRVAPKQKALVVRMIKKNIKEAITLSVGDGANDVSMILEADVGVGIYGEEGTQAAMSSDYAAGEFKCLRKLILFHGRVNYIRIAEMILYFFFKNFLFTIPQFYYAFYAACSAQTIYDDYFLSLYNLIFTSNPLLFKALMEQDVNDDDGEFIKKHIPYTYYQGREGIIFNFKNFLLNILLAMGESFIVFFFTEYIMQKSLNGIGYAADFWANSLTQFTSIIIIVNFRLLVSQRYHTSLNTIIIIITSYGSYLGYYFISSQFSFSKSQGTIYALFTFPQFYLTILLTCSMALLWDLGKNFIMVNYFDEPTTLLRRYLIDSKKKDVNKEQLDVTVSKKILDYDARVRNLYKVQRVPIPNLMTNVLDVNISFD